MPGEHEYYSFHVPDEYTATEMEMRYPMNDALMQQMFEDYCRDQEDRERYPLFFLKKGIV